MPEESIDTRQEGTEARTLLAVPNVSVGIQGELVAPLAAAFTAGGGLTELAAPHFDRDHGRAVFTLAGRPGAVADGLFRGAALALEALDFRAHQGSHPCVGVFDVAPVVYLDDQDRGAAWVEALVLADMVGYGLGVPVFLYGELAGGRSRAELRRGGLAGLSRSVEEGSFTADFGPRLADPSAGAALVTARPPLVAFNLELAPPAGLDDARRIASEIREGGAAGLPGVRAIGLLLDDRDGTAQVSVNVEDFRRVPLALVVEAVTARSPVAATELVGLAPAAAFDGFPEGLECRNRATLEDALGF